MTGLLANPTFRVDGPLPTGTTVLEASAGTGKTYTIAALATRYVAEGVAGLDQLMLVTFGRDATQELRERVRDRLAATERALAAVLAAAPVAAPDGRPGASRCWRRGDRAEVAAAPRTPGRGAPPRSTRRRSPPRTSSASRCWPGSASAGDDDPDAEFVEHDRRRRHRGGRRLLRAQVRRAGRGPTPAFDRARGAGAGPRRRRRPAGPLWSRPAPTRRSAASVRYAVRAAPCVTEVERAQAAAAPLQLRRHAHPPGRRR